MKWSPGAGLHSRLSPQAEAWREQLVGYLLQVMGHQCEKAGQINFSHELGNSLALSLPLVWKQGLSSPDGGGYPGQKGDPG